MNELQYQTLTKAFLSVADFMVLYDCCKRKAAAIKKELLDRMKKDDPNILNKLHSTVKLPTHYLLKQNYLLFNLEDFAFYSEIFEVVL